MTVGLAQRLVWDGIVGPDDVNGALHAHVTERIAFLEALVRSRPELVARLEAELGTARPGVSAVVVQDEALVALLPPGLPAALLAVPVGRDPETGAVLVVAAEPSDTHVQAELAYHLGGPVEVTFAPLRSVLAALHRGGARAEVHLTPAFGTVLPGAPAPAAPSSPASAPPPPGSSLVPSSPAPIPIENPKPSPAEAPFERHSDRPIPLVRISSDLAPPPATVKGVAPQATGAGRVSPQVVVQRRNPVPAAAEPVIELTRAKSIAPRADGSTHDSSPPMTVPGTGPLLATTLVGPVPGTASSPIATTMPAPGYESSSVAIAGESTAERALGELDEASSAEDVVTSLVRGLAVVASRVLVLAVRGKVFEGRDASDAASREAVRNLVVSGDRPSVLLTAMQTGSYLGPIPRTLVHAELARILEGANDEIAVGVVSVSGRAALVYVAAGLETAYLATRRGDQLSLAAGRALERIVRQRKK
jgi:hypothetical protein